MCLPLSGVTCLVDQICDLPGNCLAAYTKKGTLRGSKKINGACLEGVRRIVYLLGQIKLTWLRARGRWRWRECVTILEVGVNLLLGSVTYCTIMRSFLCGQEDVLFCLLDDLKAKNWVRVYTLVYVTSDFCSSGWFAALMMAMLFFWHTQHRSLIGFVTMIWGRNLCHMLVNVE